MRSRSPMGPPYAGWWPRRPSTTRPAPQASRGCALSGASGPRSDELGSRGLGIGAGRLAQGVQRGGDGGHALQVGRGHRQDLTPRRGGEGEGRDLVVLGGVEDEVGHERDAETGGGEPPPGGGGLRLRGGGGAGGGGGGGRGRGGAAGGG